MMNLEGIGPEEVAFILDKGYDIAVRSGLHCAPDAHSTIGTFSKGAVRFSVGYFNSKKDIEAVLNAINTIAAEQTKGASAR